MTHRFDVARSRDVVARWCTLAERRLEYLTELFETGRWRRFHSESDFLENIQEAKAAVETWRDLLSREASRTNAAIDVSRLGRARTALVRDEGWRAPVRPRQPAPAETPAAQPSRNPVVLLSAAAAVEDPLSARVIGGSATKLAPDMAAIGERYPLLRNAL